MDKVLRNCCADKRDLQPDFTAGGEAPLSPHGRDLGDSTQNGVHSLEVHPLEGLPHGVMAEAAASDLSRLRGGSTVVTHIPVALHPLCEPEGAEQPSKRLPVRAELKYMEAAIADLDEREAQLWSVVSECLAKLGLERVVDGEETGCAGAISGVPKVPASRVRAAKAHLTDQSGRTGNGS